MKASLRNFFSQKNGDIIILLVISISVFILNLWGYSLLDVDEPRYAETAREMLTSPGDWITPHFNWITRFDKPVLFYWLIAGAYKVFGVSEFSARLISAFAVTSIMFMLYFLAKKEWNRQVGLMTAIVFATMLEVYALGRWAVTDMTLACFMTGIWISLYLSRACSPRWLVAAGIFGGLGLLTKGPVAIALPGLTYLIFVTWCCKWDYRPFFSKWAFIGLALCLLIAIPWYVAVAQANPTFVNSFFFLHNVERFAGTVSGHSGPWFYYIPVLLLGSFPWVLFLPGLVQHVIRTNANESDLIRYALIWCAFVFLFFSFAGTKLLTYILPLYPALSLLCGWYWASLINEGGMTGYKASNLLTSGVYLMLAVFAVLLILIMFQPFIFVPDALRSLYHPSYTIILVSLLLITLAASCYYLKFLKMPLGAFTAVAIGMVVTLIFVNEFILPEVVELSQGEIRAFAERSVVDQMPLATYRMKKPSLVFYTHHHIYFLSEDKRKPTDRHHTHRSRQTFYVVAKNKDMETLQQDYRKLRTIAQGQAYSLLLIKSPVLDDSVNQ